MTSGKIPLGEYIFRRLNDLGINHIFGVPGDFNLNLIDHLYSVPGLSWVGTRNELNGAYAADGYARTRGIPGVVLTTYVVGELSAINGIGGAVAEGIPIIHIVGTTPRAAQKARLMIHHTLGQGVDHALSAEVSKPLAAAIAYLNDDSTFACDVDRVIETCWRTKLPVYLYVPVDTPDILIDAKTLSQPLNLSITNDGWGDEEDQIVDAIISSIKAASKPCFLVDLWAPRFGLMKGIKQISELLGLPAFVTPLSKSSIDESSESFGGLYQGIITPSQKVKEAIEQSDLVIHAGKFPSDTSQGGFSYNLSGKIIALSPKYCAIDDKFWDGLSFVPVIRRVLERVRSEKSLRKDLWFKAPSNNETLSQPRGPLRQKEIWPIFNKYLRKGDCVIAEVGTSQFGTLAMTLPEDARYYTQIYYSCIGFTVGATLGTLVALKEMDLLSSRRVILFVGDGSLQLTVQEISTIVHHGFTPTIVVVNNAGYTVERVIHGPTRSYNDIDPWNYQLMLKFFNAPETSRSYQARTFEELSEVLDNPDFQASKQIQVLEVILDKYDAPKNMTVVVDRTLDGGAAGLRKEDAECGRERKVLDGTLTSSGLRPGDD